MSKLVDIEAMLRGSGDLRQRIVRNLGNSTVALFAVFDSHGTDLLKLAGTDSLAVVGDSHGILTAAHVWVDVLKPGVKLGITLTNNINHKCVIDVSTVVATVVRDSASGWNQWGPDMPPTIWPESVRVFCIACGSVYSTANRSDPTY